MMVDLETVRHLCAVEAIRAAANGPLPTTSAPALSAGPEPEITDDTVDFQPVPSTDTDDTVALRQPTWVKRVTGRIDSAISGAFSRFGRTSAPVPTRQTGIRKR
jgi:hypothetical protein